MQSPGTERFSVPGQFAFLRLGRATVRVGDDGIHSGELVFWPAGREI